MEKKRTRVITGWRQVTRSKPGLSKARFSPVPRAKPDPEVRIPVAEKAANERWETEGGHLVQPAKIATTKP